VAAITWTVEPDRDVNGDRPLAEDEHPVGEQDGLVDVVRHQQHGRVVARAQVLEQAVHASPGERVERAERLVEQHQLRLADQCPGECHALCLTAGQGHRPRPGMGCQAHLAECGQALPAQAPAFVRAADLQTERDVRQHPLPRQQPRLLEDHRAALRDQHLAAVVRVEPAEDAQQRALAGAAAAEERDELARGDRDVESAQDLPVAEGTGHAAGEDRGVRGRPHR
jgi:hypothetical protein